MIDQDVERLVADRLASVDEILKDDQCSITVLRKAEDILKRADRLLRYIVVSAVNKKNFHDLCRVFAIHHHDVIEEREEIAVVESLLPRLAQQRPEEVLKRNRLY